MASISRPTFPIQVCDFHRCQRAAAQEALESAHRKQQQAAYPGLTLTGMYSVREALREGRPLTAKEQTIHEQGLVSLLRQLHDELDATVAVAYGWPPDMSDAEILTRLVALNAERAAEEATGLIRWLRPDYQNPTGDSASQTGLALQDTQAETKPKKTATKTPWPKTLPERIQAVQEALKTAPGPLTAATLAQRFARAKPEVLAEILETLATLGHIQQNGETFSL